MVDLSAQKSVKIYWNLATASKGMVIADLVKNRQTVCNWYTDAFNNWKRKKQNKLSLENVTAYFADNAAVNCGKIQKIFIERSKLNPKLSGNGLSVPYSS